MRQSTVQITFDERCRCECWNARKIPRAYVNANIISTRSFFFLFNEIAFSATSASCIRFRIPKDRSSFRPGSSLCNRDLLLPCWGHVNHMVRVIDHARVADQAIEFAKFKLCTRINSSSHLNDWEMDALYGAPSIPLHQMFF